MIKLYRMCITTRILTLSQLTTVVVSLGVRFDQVSQSGREVDEGRGEGL